MGSSQRGGKTTEVPAMVKVLVVDDSPVVREFLVHILSADPGIHVVAAVSDGEEALASVQRTRPHVVTMDIHMPKMDGLEATRGIMESHPTPIVIVSGSSTVNEATMAFRAMEAGALAVVRRPTGLGHPDHEATAAELVQAVKLMAEVKVVRRWPRAHRGTMVSPIARAGGEEPERLPEEFSLVAIGASTGGPLVLQRILSALAQGFPLPVLIVQHMSPGFLDGFAEWLGHSSGFPVRVARQGELILSGHAYVAPDGFHMEVGSRDRITLSHGEPENGLRPSVSCLFRSVARVYGEQAVGVLLTGMGKDGAEELRQMKEKGAVTIAQDEESCVVYGMPGEAVRLDAATYVLSPEKIAGALTSLVNNQARKNHQRGRVAP